MKKKLSLIVLACALTLGVSGCGSEADTTTGNEKEAMIAYSEAIVGSFSQTPNEVFDQYEEMSDLQLDLMLLQTGLPIESENFLSMIESWKAGEAECGEFKSYGEFEAEMTSSGIVVTTEAEYEDKTADIEVTFDEEQKMDSMTINAHYSTAEILKKAGLNTILGMGTVFVVLIFISFIISLFRFIPELEKKFKKNKAAEPEKAPAPAPAPVAAPAVEDVSDDAELVAVIAAAIAAAEGTSTDGFVVRSIKRRTSNKWNKWN